MLFTCAKVSGASLFYAALTIRSLLKLLSPSELELKLQKVEGENAVKEANLRENVKLLTKENDRLLHLSVERMQVMQVKGTYFFHSSQ